MNRMNAVSLALSCFVFLSSAACTEGVQNEQIPVENGGSPILDDGLGVIGEAVLGNPVGDKAVYKFYDVNCGYCRAEYPALQQLVEEYPELRIVLVNTAILGDASRSAADSMSGINNPVDYGAVLNEIMLSRTRADGESVVKFANSLGVELNLAVEETEENVRSAHLENSRDVFQALGGKGVPFFVVPGSSEGETVTSNDYPGSSLGLVEQTACGYSGPGTCESGRVLLGDAMQAYENGDQLVSRGYFKRAVDDALARDFPDRELNALCWNGALMGAASEVMPACARAVSENPENIGYIDSRGIAHAALGNASEAIGDLTTFLDEYSKLDPAERAVREDIISVLSQNDGPIGDEMLSRLE